MSAQVDHFMPAIGEAEAARSSSRLPGGFAIRTRALSAFYGRAHAIRDVTLDIPHREVTAVIGPSGCGKSTFLRCLNRMHETVAGGSVAGSVQIGGANIYGHGVNPVAVRRSVGMVFQQPTPFPTMSIAENVAAGLRVSPNRAMSRDQVRETVEKALVRAALWNEVKDRLDESALALSGGQQQRLCIARALATEPAILLLDEPTASDRKSVV